MPCGLQPARPIQMEVPAKGHAAGVVAQADTNVRPMPATNQVRWGVVPPPAGHAVRPRSPSPPTRPYSGRATQVTDAAGGGSTPERMHEGGLQATTTAGSVSRRRTCTLTMLWLAAPVGLNWVDADLGDAMCPDQRMPVSHVTLTCTGGPGRTTTSVDGQRGEHAAGVDHQRVSAGGERERGSDRRPGFGRVPPRCSGFGGDHGCVD